MRRLKEIIAVWFDDTRRARKGTVVGLFAGLAIIVLLIFMALFPRCFTHYSPYEMYTVPFSPPSPDHIMGTDTMGRDIFSRCVYGTRDSLIVAFVAIAMAGFIGVPMGCVSGYLGGKIDGLFALIMDTFYLFPIIILGIMVVVALGPSPQNVAIAAGIAIAPAFYRVVRSITLSVKERTFIEAEKAMGAGRLYIIFRHILSYSVSSVVVLVSLGVATAIFVVASLGFLGIGIPPPTPEWGTAVGLGRDGIASGRWWPSTFPGLMIVLAVIGFNLFGDSLAEITNPKLQRILIEREPK
jgi:peptide/nickel transport system permease protein